MAPPDIPYNGLLAFIIVAMIIATFFVSLRVMARWKSTQKLPFAGEDIAIYVALVAFYVESACYFAMMPTLYTLIEIFEHKRMPYPGFQDDIIHMITIFVSVLTIFWLTLWAVKISLLLMFKRLTNGLPMYIKAWWFVLGFTILAYITAVISDVVIYPETKAWYTGGMKGPEPEAAVSGTAAGMWYALAVDLLTDLMIMVIPLRLLWNLQINLRQKIGLAFVFTVSFISIAVACIRSAELNNAQSAGPKSTQWAIFWGTLESMVVIIVGCLPSFAVFLRGQTNRSTAASRPTKPSKLSSYQSSKGEKSHIRSETYAMEDQNSTSQDGESVKSLVGAHIRVTRDYGVRRGDEEEGMVQQQQKRVQMFQ